MWGPLFVNIVGALRFLCMRSIFRIINTVGEDNDLAVYRVWKTRFCINSVRKETTFSFAAFSPLGSVNRLFKFPAASSFMLVFVVVSPPSLL